MKKYRWTRIALLSTFFLLLIGATCLPLWNVLAICRRDGTCLQHFVAGSSTFYTQYTHSVNKGLVVEHYCFSTKTQRIWLTAGWFENFGAGMLDGEQAGVSRVEEDGFIKLTFPVEPINALHIIPGPESRHILYYGGQEVDLYQLSPQKSITIEIQKSSLWGLLDTHTHPKA